MVASSLVQAQKELEKEEEIDRTVLDERTRHRSSSRDEACQSNRQPARPRTKAFLAGDPEDENAPGDGFSGSIASRKGEEEEEEEDLYD